MKERDTTKLLEIIVKPVFFSVHQPITLWLKQFNFHELTLGNFLSIFTVIKLNVYNNGCWLKMVVGIVL